MATTVDPRYELGDLVATGGMADVYRGRDRVLDRPVAIKRLRAPIDDPAAHERFQREAYVLARFHHPHAVAVYDAIEDEHGPLIVMEYVDGRTLRAVLRDAGHLPVDQAVAVADQLLDVLAVAHAQGIVHRDIKPANVLVTGDGVVKLADFGIATMVDAAELTHTGEVVGTPKYLAPEQTVGQPATPQSDLYAVGLLLYEMVGGRPPFERDSPAATMAAHRHDPVPPLRELQPDVPDWYVAVLERALAKDPAQRYHDAEAMRGALRAGARGDVTVVESTLPLPVTVDTDEPARRAPTVWPIVLFVVLGALVALGVWALGDDEPPPVVGEVPTTVVTVPTSKSERSTVTTRPVATTAPPVPAVGNAEERGGPAGDKVPPGQAKKER